MKKWPWVIYLDGLHHREGLCEILIKYKHWLLRYRLKSVLPAKLKPKSLSLKGAIIHAKICHELSTIGHTTWKACVKLK